MTSPDPTAHAVSEATALAREAFRRTVASTAAERAVWLEAAADALDRATTELVSLADEETRLGEARLTGEVARTSGQLRLFASALREGSLLEAIIDRAAPQASPPRPDLRRMLRPLGPVAVFSASNFPFAFSVAGGDTASALAAGCPVVVKAHSAHPRLSRRTAGIVAAALEAAGAPHGVLTLVEGRQAGIALVQDPEIRAVGFTGSQDGGRVLADLAAARPAPIPFYGELSAVNPVLITAAALAERAEELASGLLASFTLGAGQFCTKPGIVLVPEGTGFAERLAGLLGVPAATPMLSEAIGTAFRDGLDDLRAHPDIRVIAEGRGSAERPGAPAVLATTADAVLADPDRLLVECFGPVTVVVDYRNMEEALDVVRAIGGSLTATVHAESGDDLSEIVPALTELAGRVLFGGWPTGVAVTWSQQHGGPWPATTSIHTSVGVTAVRRFQRPIAFQDAPASALPAELRDENPTGIPRRVDGRLELPGPA